MQRLFEGDALTVQSLSDYTKIQVATKIVDEVAVRKSQDTNIEVQDVSGMVKIGSVLSHRRWRT